MSSAIAYRGCAVMWSDGCAGVSALESKTVARGGLVIAADARLDNRDELIAALGMDHGAGAISDADLILRAYERWGEQTPRYLLGDFAFAIWDATAQRFFCARDHFGVKQFYYYLSDRMFAFATEIRALLALQQVPRRVNEARLADLLLNLQDDCAGTLYQEVLRLPPASSISVGPQTVARREFWQLDPAREIRLRSDGDYAEAYRHLLATAVSCRVPQDGPVGAALSGGLDSSAVACLARDALFAAGRPPLHTFSCAFAEVPASDERSYVDAVPEDGRLIKHFANPHSLGPLGGGTDWGWPQDEPLWNPTTPLSRAVYAAARAAGVRVYLEGLGGDAVCGHGRQYLNELSSQGQWIRLVGEAFAWTSHHGGSPWRIVGSYARRRLRRGGDILSIQAPDTPLPVPFSAAFIRRNNIVERCRESLLRRQRLNATPRLAQWRDLTSSQLPSLSLPFTDRLGARMGLEVRHPLLDRRLVEFCLALPSAQKQGQGWSRLIARRALAGILPDQIRWRPGKTTFGAVIDYGLRHVDHAVAAAILRDRSGPLADYFDMDKIEIMHHRFLTWPQSTTGNVLWSVATIGLWLRPGETSEPAAGKMVLGKRG